MRRINNAYSIIVKTKILTQIAAFAKTIISSFDHYI